MPSFSREVEVMAPREAVWAVVSDIDNEPEYWHGTREVRNASREGNVTNREITQNFLGTKVVQRVTLVPMESVVVEYQEGTTVGTKTVSVEEKGERRQLVRVKWDIRFTGLLRIATPIIKGHVVKGTENALERIKEVAETRGRSDEKRNPAVAQV